MQGVRLLGLELIQVAESVPPQPIIMETVVKSAVLALHRRPNQPPTLTLTRMRGVLSLLALLNIRVTSLCRLTIPDSGGASQLPTAFADTRIGRVSIAPDTIVPGESLDSPPIRDFCAGPEGCGRACCTVNNCFAWAWKTAGSVHAACGANSCELFTSPSPYGWSGLKSGATLYGGYNYAGYIFNDVAEKIACCVTGLSPGAHPKGA